MVIPRQARHGVCAGHPRPEAVLRPSLRPLLRVGLVLVLSAAAAACSSAVRKPEVHRVAMRGMQFVPAEVTAAAGDTIVWVNEDIVPHTATAAGVFDSGKIESKAEWRVVVEQKGVVAYTCAFHPMMKATIAVR
jgi:plastocyanin